MFSPAPPRSWPACSSSPAWRCPILAGLDRKPRTIVPAAPRRPAPGAVRVRRRRSAAGRRSARPARGGGGAPQQRAERAAGSALPVGQNRSRGPGNRLLFEFWTVDGGPVRWLVNNSQRNCAEQIESDVCFDLRCTSRGCAMRHFVGKALVELIRAALKLGSHGAVHLHHRRRGLLPRQRSRLRGARRAAAGARLQGPPAQARPLSQRRSGHDVALPARRGVRHRRRRRDRPRPRPLRALHRPPGDPAGQHHHRPHLPGHHRPRSGAATISAPPCRSSRTSPTPSRNSSSTATTAIDFVLVEIGGTVGDIEGLPFFEAIRQLGNELPRQPRRLHPPDAAALHPDGRRAEDQADPALGQGTALDRHPAGHPAVPLRPADPEGGAPQDRAVLQRARKRRDPGAATSPTSTTCRCLSRRRPRRRGAGRLRHRPARRARPGALAA